MSDTNQLTMRIFLIILLVGVLICAHWHSPHFTEFRNMFPSPVEFLRKWSAGQESTNLYGIPDQ